MFQNVLKQNPDARQILDMVRSNNVSLEQLARLMANKRGIDINALIQEIRG